MADSKELEMSQQHERADEDEGELRQFEKNRFFQGKLITARDMEAEQAYHARRLHAMNRFATGRGILRGLEVSAVDEGDTELEVTLEPGMAVDGYGRPIVVEHTTTQTLPIPSGDELYLFLRFEESDLESVRVPEIRGATNEEYMANRTVESFELTYQESPPEAFAEIPSVDTAVSDHADEDTARRTLGNRYHQRNRTPLEPVDDPSIYVGAFERTRDGSWIKAGETVRRELVYDNDMLYAALINHIRDTENPHNIGMAGGDLDIGDEQLREFREQLEVMNDQLSTLNRYVMRKSLKDKIRFFDDVSARFEDHDTSGSRIAQEIVETAKAGMSDSAYDDPEDYRDHVGDMLELDINLGEALEASATEDSLERYVRAVNELQEVLANDENVLRVAEAQDGVCEAADSLEVLYDIVPE
jgi:hypothetical protein